MGTNLIALFCFGSCVQCFQPFPDGLFYEVNSLLNSICCILIGPKTYK